MTVNYQKNITMMERPEGKEVMGASAEPLNPLEQKALGNLDADKLNDLAESLFVLNNRHYGRIPGAYMVVCVEEGRTWCVGQLNADRRRPLVIYEDLTFDSPERARAAAEELKQSRGEVTPCRNH